MGEEGGFTWFEQTKRSIAEQKYPISLDQQPPVRFVFIIILHLESERPLFVCVLITSFFFVLALT